VEDCFPILKERAGLKGTGFSVWVGTGFSPNIKGRKLTGL